MDELLLVTSQNTPVALRLTHQLLEHFPEHRLRVLFERRPKTLKQKIKGQIRHLRHSGLLWIPYRACAFALDRAIGAFGRPENEETLLSAEESLAAQYGSRFKLEMVPNLHAREVTDRLRAEAPELGVVFGTRILRPVLFSVPKAGMINIHQGVIPFFRGMPPGFWELFNRIGESGVTIHTVNEVLDGGLIVYQRVIPLFRTDTLKNVQARLDNITVEMLPEAVHRTLRGDVSRLHPNLAAGSLYRRPTVQQILRLHVKVAFRRFVAAPPTNE